MKLRVSASAVLISCLVGCGSDGADGGDAPGATSGGSSSASGGGSSVPSGPYGTLDNPIFPEGESILGNSGDGAGGGDVPGADCADLEHTQVRYCTRATPDCSTPGAGCMLLVVHNTDGPMSWVDDPAYGSLVVTKGNGTSDGKEVKHWVGELPLTVMRQYPGIDPKRVFFLGWSHGAGAAYRGICHASKGNGISAFGNNGEIYAGMVTLGGCPACSESWAPTGRMHTLAINGADDIFAGDGCEESLRFMAQDNACSGNAQWANVTADDALMSGGNGSAIATKLDFGECANGAVAGYRFRDEGHVLSFKKNFDPKVSGLQMAFEFLKDKSK
jgi:hypothetical protein